MQGQLAGHLGPDLQCQCKRTVLQLAGLAVSGLDGKHQVREQGNTGTPPPDQVGLNVTDFIRLIYDI